MAKHTVALFTMIFLSATTSQAAIETSKFVLTDKELTDKLKIEPMFTHPSTGTVLVRLSDVERERLAEEAHERGRCAGHELVSELPGNASPGQILEYAQTTFRTFDAQLARDKRILKKQSGPKPKMVDPLIEAAVKSVSEQNLKDTVQFLSNYKTRQHQSNEAKLAIADFKTRIETTLKGTALPYKIDLIAHKSTPMNSIRLTFAGQTKPDEVVVAGAHIDSVNQSFFGSKVAPGSDDNASGSANILEAARIIATGAQPLRTIEFYWYAGEEGGLLGSQEIAADAKAKGKKVVGVLQLDMTLFPGDGEFNLGSMTDFTSQDMRDLLTEINRNYLQATITEDKCGYGCSDHASWYRNGYPTLMPFESTKGKMNKNIHSERDTVTSSMSFKHSAMFSKIAVAFLMTLSR